MPVMTALAAGRVKKCAQLYNSSSPLSEILDNLVISWAEQNILSKAGGIREKEAKTGYRADSLVPSNLVTDFCYLAII